MADPSSRGDVVLMAQDVQEVDVAQPVRAEPFAWPTPPFANYPAPVWHAEPEVCEIEGPTGSARKVRLIALDPTAGVAFIQAPPARTTMTVRFSQFRRLVLTRPLQPLTPVPVVRVGEGNLALTNGPALSYEVRLHGGEVLRGMTVGDVSDAYGHFLFEPVDDIGSVRRIFLPAHAVEHLQVGERIGQVLIDQNQIAPEQVEIAAAEQRRLRLQRVGDLLVDRQIVVPEQLEEALERQASMPMVRLGEALLALGLVDQTQLDEALEQQRKDRGVPIGELLMRKGLITREQLANALARKMGYPVVDVMRFQVEAEALCRVTYSLAKRLQVLPLVVRNGRLIVAVEDPSRTKAMDEIEFAAGCKVVPVIALGGSVLAGITAAYQKLGAEVWSSKSQGGELPSAGNDAGGADSIELLASLEQGSGDATNEDDKQIEQSDNSLVRLINSMIVEAHNQAVSDIHIETQPNKEKVRIRFRRDGMLKPYLELPHTYRAALIARIKIMCDLDISERRKPQDGKITFNRFVAGSRLELRVATIPTFNGLEDAVLRLLSSARPMALDDLGLSPRNKAHVKSIVQRPYGMFLCVGPTGSGKTTTMHAVLGYINVPERKIWTAEDPVEITQPGLRQVQVNPKIDWTFAKALRAFLRADPDVILVGEIRDQETAQVAIESSLTGHLLLSTLHTNSAAETVTRLLDMGMDPFNFGDSLLGVLAQRLVRRLCTHCRTSRPMTDEERDELLADYMNSFPRGEAPPAEEVLAEWADRFGEDRKLMHYHSVGCDKCGNTGLRGRAGIHELLTVGRELKHRIQTGARVEELQAIAMREGMHTLRQDGIEKVLAGVTNISEVRASSNA